MIKKTLILLLLFGVNTMANTTDAKVSYWLQFKLNNISCKITLNDLYVYSTFISGVPQLQTFGHPTEQYMQEGLNIFKIHAVQPNNILTDSELKKGYCEISVRAVVPNPTTNQVETKEVTMIRITIDKEGKFSIAETKDFPEPTLTTKPLLKTLDKSLSGAKNHDIEVTRTLMVNHPQPFSWVKATPFKDTATNRELLWQKYEEFRSAFTNKDIKALRQLVEPGLTEMARHQNDSVDNHFNIVSEQLDWSNYINNKEWKLVDIKKNDYELELYAEGKLFRFVKRNTINSPIRWLKDGIVGFYNPVFTLIDGKIVMAVF